MAGPEAADGQGERLEDYDYALPPELIAQFPPPERDGARMLVLARAGGTLRQDRVAAFPAYLRAGDCLIVNDSRVLAARLLGRKESGSARIEALLLAEREPGLWQAMLRPGKRVPPGTRVVVADEPGAAFVVVAHEPEGTFLVRFAEPDVLGLLERHGHLPLPPYIDRPDEAVDRERYQTVFARAPGSVAAPTAGLHFTPAMLAALAARGVARAAVTLHVGAGTFKPVTAARLADHVMHAEHYVLPPATAAVVNETRARGGRVFAVGTTAVRVLESCATADGRVRAESGQTRLFLHPPQVPRVVDGLLTNFHLPRSTLLLLVSTFAPREAVLAAYRLAVAERWRFFSYGDCMLLYPGAELPPPVNGEG